MIPPAWADTSTPYRFALTADSSTVVGESVSVADTVTLVPRPLKSGVTSAGLNVFMLAWYRRASRTR